MTSQAETFEFQSETRQLLQLMIHSIYSNKDIFLRELISNASDALDKLRIEAFRDKDLDVDTSDLHVEVHVDKEQRTLTVRDNGIGMTRDEVISMIGTIAKSGSAEFVEKLKEAQEAGDTQGLIGQFGVGFYSSFMVADRVTLLTRHASAEAGVCWESTGEGSYTLEDVADAPQGTSVTLHLAPADEENQLAEYTSPWKIRQIIKRYSDFITWPIRMPAESSDSSESSDESESSEDDSTGELETVNSMKALWTRPSSDVSDEEYNEFYKHISHDFLDPLETIRLHAEGTFEYQALLFIPAQAPMDLFMRDRKRGAQLYVKRVFIMEDCEALIPEYLRFVKGVVDAEDLSLNVSRETLQADRQIQMIRKRLVRKVLSTIKEMMSNSPDRYATLWAEFGRAIKEGLVEEPENKDQILEICSFPSTHDPQQPTTLHDYVARMNSDQEHIYYTTGESRSIVENSPHMEAFRSKGIEVLLLTDPVDEMWVDSVGEFEGKTLQSIAKGDMDLGSEDDQQSDEDREKQQQEFAGLLSWMGTTLQDNVKEVRLSSRLTNSPACIVGDSGDVTPTLEKMYRAMGQEIPQIKRILELNPTHPLVSGLRDAYERQGENAEQGSLTNDAELLYDMALIAEGGELTDPSRFVTLLSNRLTADS